jgi:4-hydroxy-3-methylbut-2-enyl diphosphate reductase
MEMKEKYFRKGFGLKSEVSGSIEKEYNSRLIDYIRSLEGVLSCGDTTVKLAKEFGFCYGVDRSVEYAYQTVKRFPDKNIYLTGEIIHNPFVNRRLVEMGVHFLSGANNRGEKLSDIGPQDVVILPAFGVPVALLEELGQKECILVDTTCGSVLIVWKHVEKFSQEGFTAIVHGKYYHEETIATVSRTILGGNGKYIIVKDIPETRRVCDFIDKQISSGEFLRYFAKSVSPGFDPERDLVKIGVANQTTMLASESRQVGDLVRAALIRRYGPGNIEQHFRAFDTICSATQDRQDAIRELLQSKPGLTLVIGGFNSSNTRSLCSLAAQYGPAFHIEEETDLLNPEQIRHLPAGLTEPIISPVWLPSGKIIIAVTAGASTPNAKIGVVISRIFALRNQPLPLELEELIALK